MLNDPELERTIIGHALVSGGFSVESRKLSTQDFYTKEHGNIWSAIIEIDEDGEAVDPFEVHKRYPSVSLTDLSKMMAGIPPTPPRETDIRRFREMSIRRQFRKTLDHFIKQLENAEIASVLPDVESALDNVKKIAEKTSTPVKQLAEVMENDVFPRLDKFAAGECVKLPFGFKALDQATNGGVSLGELVILGAKPKRGKSGLVLQIADYHAECGDAALVVSREMLNYENGFRYLAQHSSYSNNVFRPDLMQQTADKLKEIGRGYKDRRLFFDDRSKKMSDIRREARILKETHELKSVFIDYAQLMRPDRKHNNRAEDLEQIYYDAKELAQDLELAVYVNAQFNRSGIKSDRPTMADFDGSSAAEKAGNLILLWELEQDYDDLLKGRRGKLWIEAGRNVANDEFEIVFHGAHSKFSFREVEEFDVP